MAKEAKTQSFDALAKGLARGDISRRRALKLMGIALFGGALASVPGLASATPSSNSVCKDYCTEVFPPGPQRGQCISQGAQGSGPCYECNKALGVFPAVGPYFQCPPGSIIDDFDPQYPDCCHPCTAQGGVVCGAGGRDPNCYFPPFECGHGGTIDYSDPSNCTCNCPPGYIVCDNTFGAPGHCTSPVGGPCANVNECCSSQGSYCVDGRCVSCQPPGSPCTSETLPQCCSGLCVDGFCSS